MDHYAEFWKWCETSPVRRALGSGGNSEDLAQPLALQQNLLWKSVMVSGRDPVAVAKAKHQKKQLLFRYFIQCDGIGRKDIEGEPSLLSGTQGWFLWGCMKKMSVHWSPGFKREGKYRSCHGKVKAICTKKELLPSASWVSVGVKWKRNRFHVADRCD